MSTNEYLHDLPEVRFALYGSILLRRGSLIVLVLLFSPSDQAADHVVEFLSKFYKIFPEFANHDVRPSLFFGLPSRTRNGVLMAATLGVSDPLRPTSPASLTRANTFLTSPARSSKRLGSRPASRAS